MVAVASEPDISPTTEEDLDGLDDHEAAHAAARQAFAALTMSERLDFIDRSCFEMTSFVLDAKRTG